MNWIHVLGSFECGLSAWMGLYAISGNDVQDRVSAGALLFFGLVFLTAVSP